MRNRDLAADYLRRAGIRLKAIEVLFQGESWADVVRESQEVVELGLKGLLRACGVEAPRIHDVSDVLLAERARLPSAVQSQVDRLAHVSRALRRDRELAFYGAEDLTPSSFYSKEDAQAAFDGARLVVKLARPVVGQPDSPAG
jgi:HEPN domain-containing protein